MIRKTILGLVLVLAVLGLRAEDDAYICWLVDMDDQAESLSAYYSGYSGFRLSAFTLNGEEWEHEHSFTAYLDTSRDASSGDSEVSKTDMQESTDWGGEPYYGLLSEYTGTAELDELRFYIEVMGDGGALGRSDNYISGSSLASYLRYSGSSAPMSGTATFSGTFSIPEPTSGTLALFGLALLALRRRRA